MKFFLACFEQYGFMSCLVYFYRFMDIQLFLHELGAELANTPAVEWGAVLFGVAEVLLALNNRVLLYPAGIISTALSIYLLANAKLYAESALNIYYLVMSIYGWYHWVRRKNEPPLPITKATIGDWRITLVIVAGAWAALYFILSRYTPSDVPAMDAWVSATAWAGMWLLARRKVENWLLLNVSNIFAIPLLVYKQLPLYACLTIVLFIVAVFGYFKWKRICRLQLQTAALEH